MRATVLRAALRIPLSPLSSLTRSVPATTCSYAVPEAACFACRVHLLDHLSNDRRFWEDMDGTCAKTLLLGRTLIMRFCTGRCVQMQFLDSTTKQAAHTWISYNAMRNMVLRSSYSTAVLHNAHGSSRIA